MSGSRGRPTSVVVLDTDGVNPYGGELAALLTEGGADVTLVAPRDAALLGEADRSLGLRETRGPASWTSLAREAISVLRVCFWAILGRPIIAVWARSYMQVLLGVVAALPWSRVAYILHNPVPGRRPVGTRRRMEARLLRRALVVVHGAAYVRSAMEEGAVRVAVVPHVPYRRFCERHGLTDRPPGSGAGGSPTYLLFGSVREDKFSVAQLRTLVSEFERSGVEGRLLLAVHPPVGIRSESARLEVDDRSSPDFLPDTELANCVRESDVVLAPYTNATESGTVQLALSAGRAVIAFDVGVLRASLPAPALVPPGDLAAFAQRCREFRDDPWAPEPDWLDRRTAASLGGWAAVLEELRRRGTEPSGGP